MSDINELTDLSDDIETDSSGDDIVDSGSGTDFIDRIDHLANLHSDDHGIAIPPGVGHMISNYLDSHDAAALGDSFSSWWSSHTADDRLDLIKTWLAAPLTATDPAASLTAVMDTWNTAHPDAAMPDNFSGQSNHENDNGQEHGQGHMPAEHAPLLPDEALAHADAEHVPLPPDDALAHADAEHALAVLHSHDFM